jgi:DNA (cytosine-5)-methyltransferase 1
MKSKKNGKENKPKLISLFSGAGGMDIGFLLAGFEIIWANDVDENACESYTRNLQKHITCRDIAEVDIESVPNADIIIGGFPCQDFSVLGGSNRKGLLVKRGRLYKYFLKFVKAKMPAVFLAENVKGIKSANRGLALKLIVRDFENLENVDLDKLDEAYSEALINYDLEKAQENVLFNKSGNDRYAQPFYKIYTATVNFANYGVPQLRERVLIIGIRNDIAKLHSFEFPEPLLLPSEYVTAGEVFDGKVIYNKPVCEIEYNNEIPKISSRTSEMLRAIPEGGNYKDLPENLIVKGLMSNIYRKLSYDKPSYTVIANGGGGTWGYHYQLPRTLTNRERARLQTFPDWYVFDGGIGEVRKQIGNAVPPLGIMPFAFALKRVLAPEINESSDPCLMEYQEFTKRLKKARNSKFQNAELQFKALIKKPVII